MIFWLLACAPSTPDDIDYGAYGATGDGAEIVYHVTNPLDDSDSSVEDALLAHIQQARYSIDVAAYDLGALAPAEALVAAAARGVAVRVVTDADELDAHGIAVLEEAGIAVYARPAGDRIMHHKFAIFDEQGVWTGSTNWTETGFTMNNNHALYLPSQPLAERFTEEMEQLVAGDFGRDKSASTFADEPITSGGLAMDYVGFAPQDDPVVKLIEAIDQADESIHFMIYSFTRADVVDALVAAHERGVDVVGIFDESQARMWYSVDEDLAAAGIPVYIDGNHNTAGYAGGKLHHKVMLIDAETSGLVVTGSMNWSNSGNYYNDENLLIFQSDTVSASLYAEFCTQFSIASVHPDAPEADVACDHAADPVDHGPAIQINELLPNPSGTDRGQEFIELVNTSGGSVSLEGWTVTDGQNRVRHTFSGALPAYGGLVLFDQGDHSAEPGSVLSTTGYLSLNNDGDTISLYDADGVLVDTVTYTHSSTGVSWNRASDGASTQGPAEWVKHNTLSDRNSSPGTLADGTLF